MASNVLVGGRAQFWLNGSRMGWAMGCNITEDITQEPVNVLDMIMPAEHVATYYVVQMQCQIYKVPTKDIVAAGLWPMSGKTADDQKRILVEFEPMTAQIWDSYLQIPVAKLRGLKPRTRSMQVQARGLVATNCTFVGLYFGDEGTAEI